MEKKRKTPEKIVFLDIDRVVRRFSLQGTEDDFRKIAGWASPKIRRLLFLMIGPCREDREDAEQEILLALHSGIKYFRFESSFKTFFYRLCRNKARDFIRRKARDNRRLKRSGLLLPLREEPDPEKKVLRAQDADDIMEILRKLPAQDRFILYMKDGEELTIEEISSVLNMPKGTVKSRLHRTRKKAAMMASELFGEEE
jgi:RNA polymerase sigma-70 factor, ECF subfamily